MTIKTVPRFIFLNAYAFLLVFLCIGITVISFVFCSGVIFAACLFIALICLHMGIKIFATWPGKIKHYNKLMETNSQLFSPDSFKEYIQAPCGSLLTRVVLKDLGKTDQYPNLCKLRLPLRERIRSIYEPHRTVIYIREHTNSSENASNNMIRLFPKPMDENQEEFMEQHNA